MTKYFLVAAMALSAIFPGAARSQKHPAAPSSEERATQTERGRTVYHDRCEICHFSDSTAQKIGPGLKDIYKRKKFSGGTKVDDASMEKWILNGSNNMPPFRDVLSVAEIHDVIAYLKSI
jgi:cytochrome c2